MSIQTVFAHVSCGDLSDRSTLEAIVRRTCLEIRTRDSSFAAGNSNVPIRLGVRRLHERRVAFVSPIISISIF